MISPSRGIGWRSLAFRQTARTVMHMQRQRPGNDRLLRTQGLHLGFGLQALTLDSHLHGPLEHRLRTDTS